MGKGDKKTRRGKVTAGSYGKTRPRKSGTSKVAAPKVEAKAEKPSEQIDFIFSSKNNTKVLKYRTITDFYNYKYPSDHFPIVAKIKLK